MSKEAYYLAGKPEISKVYSCDDAVLLSIKNRHDGPWDETERLRE